MKEDRRSGEDRRHYTDTDFGRMDESQQSLDARLGALADGMEAIKVSVRIYSADLADHAKNLKANTDATEALKKHADDLAQSQKRIEESIEGLPAAWEVFKNSLTGLDWLAKIGTKVLWIAVPGAFLLGGWTALKQWVMKW